jgi:hypothetical protein
VGFPTLCLGLCCGVVVHAVDGEGFAPASLKYCEPASSSVIMVTLSTGIL